MNGINIPFSEHEIPIGFSITDGTYMTVALVPLAKECEIFRRAILNIPSMIHALEYLIEEAKQPGCSLKYEVDGSVIRMAEGVLADIRKEAV